MRNVKKADTLALGFVTAPSNIDEDKKNIVQRSVLDKLTEHVDTIFLIPEEKLLQAIRSTRIILNGSSLISMELSDFRKVIAGGGLGHIGFGNFNNDNQDSIHSGIKTACDESFLKRGIQGVGNIIVFFYGDVGLKTINAAISYVQNTAGPDANIILGLDISEDIDNEAFVIVIATWSD